MTKKNSVADERFVEGDIEFSVPNTSSNDNSDVIDEDEDETACSTNTETLKQEIHTLRRKLAHLEKREKSRRRRFPSLREMSMKLRRSPLTINDRKDSDVDLQGSIRQNDDSEASNDIEMHESGRGLHHRKFTHHQHGTHSSTTKAGTTEGLRLLKSQLPDYDDDDEEMLVRGPHRHSQHIITHDDFCSQIKDRAGWLVGLLCLQSLSSFIIQRNEKLLEEHIVVVQFLTMLVGAGGNAGNQASVRVIRGLAIGTIHNDNLRAFLSSELRLGLVVSAIIGLAGCLRAALFMVPLAETLAITTSLVSIVMISIILGALMPLGMKKIGIDPAHSSTTIQVVMDILGVAITVHVSSTILNSAFHNWLTGG